MGVIQSMAQVKDMTKKKFGKLLVVSFSHIHNHEAMWNCICDCGQEITVSGHNLRAGYSRSCGCQKNEDMKKRFTKHGHAGTRLYQIWRGMHRRCSNPKEASYKWYGAKGIRVCDEWNTIDAFIEWAQQSGYSPELTIDRIDSKLNYCPENCQWLSREDNTRKATTKRVGGV